MLLPNANPTIIDSVAQDTIKIQTRGQPPPHIPSSETLVHFRK